MMPLSGESHASPENKGRNFTFPVFRLAEKLCQCAIMAQLKVPFGTVRRSAGLRDYALHKRGCVKVPNDGTLLRFYLRFRLAGFLDFSGLTRTTRRITSSKSIIITGFSWPFVLFTAAFYPT
jgi:hypothetical protein